VKLNLLPPVSARPNERRNEVAPGDVKGELTAEEIFEMENHANQSPRQEDSMTAPAATAPQADTKDATEAGTEYVILTLDESGMWDRNAKDYARNVTARSAEQAVRKHVELRAAKQGGVIREGTFVAIPAKSWKRITVTPQTVTTLKLEEAK
jgi:hypothetical protein